MTSAFTRFRDLVLSFSGEVATMPCAPLGRPQVDAVVTAAESHVVDRKDWTEGRVRFRDQALDRAGFEACRLALRESRATLDHAIRALADQAGIPWLSPAPSALTIVALCLGAPRSDGPLAGYWVRSPEPLDLRGGDADARVGRTVVELAHRPVTGAQWTLMPTVQLANADGTDVVLVPTGVPSGEDPGAWPTGRYRMTFTYRRYLAAEPEDDRSDLPVEERLGSDAPERVHLDWTV